MPRENKIVKLHHFTVEGKHDLPWDMLRYDRCWPASEANIAEFAPYHRSELYSQTRQVKLIGLSEPTIARWESFGWKVVQHEVRTYN